jgi:hypothetical protein
MNSILVCKLSVAFFPVPFPGHRFVIDEQVRVPAEIFRHNVGHTDAGWFIRRIEHRIAFIYPAQVWGGKIRRPGRIYSMNASSTVSAPFSVLPIALIEEWTNKVSSGKIPISAICFIKSFLVYIVK